MEGFFSHLKEEWFRIRQPGTVDEFHTGLSDYLQWWNTTRIQQRLGYLSPTSTSPNLCRHIRFNSKVQLSGTTPLLRDYFPKGTELAHHSPKHLLAVEEELNNRPRVILHDQSPAQLFTALLAPPVRPCCDVD